MSRTFVRSLLFLFLVPAFSAYALDFREQAARELFASGTKPVMTGLRSSLWLQVAGTALYDVAKSPWAPGPVGSSESGAFSSLNAMGKLRVQQRTQLEFLSLEGQQGTFVSLRSFAAPGEIAPVSSYHLPVREAESAFHFRVTREGNFQMAKDYPGDFGGAAAAFECRSRGQDLLVCAATFGADALEQAPAVLRPFAGKVFYYSLYKRQRDPGAPGAATSSGTAAPAPVKRKGIKCAMSWGGNSQVEILSFTMLERPARLGKGSMAGVGASWTAAFPGVRDRVVVLKADEEGGYTTFAIVNAAKSGFNENWDVSAQIKNSAGLPMVGTIRVPQGGGESEVRYPPGWGQDAKAYAESSARAPKQAFCKEIEVPAPADPYAEDAGALK